jgi:hypothetical protein
MNMSMASKLIDVVTCAIVVVQVHQAVVEAVVEAAVVEEEAVVEAAAVVTNGDRVVDAVDVVADVAVAIVQTRYVTDAICQGTSPGTAPPKNLPKQHRNQTKRNTPRRRTKTNGVQINIMDQARWTNRHKQHMMQMPKWTRE